MQKYQHLTGEPGFQGQCGLQDFNLIYNNKTHQKKKKIPKANKTKT